MARKRGKSKRSTKYRRIKKYYYKADPRTTNIAFKQRLDPMATDLDFWLTLLDNLEKRVIALCQAQGIPTEEIVSYIAYAKKQFKWIDRFTALSLWYETQIKVAEAVVRGLKESKSLEILPLLYKLKEEADFYRKYGYWYREVYISDVKLLVMKLEQTIHFPTTKELGLSISQTYSFPEVKSISNVLSQTVVIE
jgi:hypothetical protein